MHKFSKYMAQVSLEIISKLEVTYLQSEPCRKLAAVAIYMDSGDQRPATISLTCFSVK